MTISRLSAHDDGFSLVEMLAVVAVLALAAAIVVPFAARPADGLRLQAAGRELAAGLRLTRTAAILRNEELVFDLDVEQRRFGSPAVPPVSLPTEIMIKLKFAKAERASASQAGFRFFPDGSSTGGDINLAIGGRSVQICVDWLTGEPRMGQAC